MKTSLAHKMQFLSPPGAGRSEHPQQPGPETLVSAVSTEHAGLLACMGGQIVENELGCFWRRRQILGGHLCHGPTPLQWATQLESSILRRLEPKFRQFDLSRAVYFDTETTGLSGGSGTYPFLIGLAYFEKDQDQWRLVVEQLMMAEHSQEKALLAYLVDLLRSRSGLVSFNGKSFDAPLLDTRLCLHRYHDRLENLPHLDLLPWARRLWSKALPDCRLETLESQLLRLPRQQDIPGWMIPEAYFRFLRERDARPLVLVAEHNRRDILAMVGLVAGLVHLICDPWECQHRFLPELQPFEDLAIGRLLFRQNHPQANQLFQRAYEQLLLLKGNEAVEARLLAGRLYARSLQRQQRYEEAHRIWLQLVESHPRVEGLWESLAKSLEHRLKDLPAAHRATTQALSLPGLSNTRRRRWEHRQQRLLQKLRP